MSIKTSFSIKDLENLSGIKAHTIRIWEKRYNLLEPERSDSNIRTYNLESLQKILNVSFLNQNGHKISKIADMNEEELCERVNQIGKDKKENLASLNDFKMAMLNFDQSLFDKTYNNLLNINSFEEIFLKEFVVLLEDIGKLWATKTISPMHERFISTLIKQKLLLSIEKKQNSRQETKDLFVLFLPVNEMHDIGLLYIHLILLSKGHKSIFLGSGIPIEDLKELQKIYDNITFVSYFTIEPTIDSALEYITKIDQSILSLRGEKLHVLGKNTAHLFHSNISKNVSIHKSLPDLLNSV